MFGIRFKRQQDEFALTWGIAEAIELAKLLSKATKGSTVFIEKDSKIRARFINGKLKPGSKIK